MNAMAKSELSHFMDLEERTDLLFQAEDPLNIPGPEPFEAVEWSEVKQEIPEGIQISQIKLADIAVIKKRVQDFTREEHEFTQLELTGCLEKDKDVAPANQLENFKETTLNEQKDGTEENSALKDSEPEELDASPRKSRKNLPHPCTVCKKILSSKGSFRLHMWKKHEIKIQFSCELCSKKFDLQRDLLKHRNTDHRSEDGKFTCDKCGRSLVDYQNFVIHTRSHNVEGNDDYGDGVKDLDGIHKVFTQNGEGVLKEKMKQEKNFICDTCGIRFAFRCLLRDHLNLHTGVKPYLCPVCGRSYSQKASLKQHSRTHNAVKPHKCPECPQGFYGKGDLKKHMRKHTGERPYVCEMCGEGFSQSSHLCVHRRSHKGERPYLCDVCGRGFAKRGDVLRHRRIHTGELPYLCQVCGKKFRQSTQCSNHIKNHHPDSLVPVARNTTLLTSS